ncbi:HugZ family pyridoxamine 5'-phosphate oxidase [Yoonia sp. 2307UL14-13]|uniref:HugZ family pyridoxamine 5'-phosphate oxidase n=1 Tax=Yoonia sp. 2307UL14-13 TaxID=3126506 RepID=UPI0030979C46
MARRDPINATDEEARQLARDLLRGVRYGALAVTLPERPVPYVARVAMIWADGTLLTLISTLSTHTAALQANRACAVLVGEPGDKVDPLTHPRMTLLCDAIEADKAAWKQRWLTAIPKAQLYYDFTDFLMFELIPTEVHLNGGFGKAYRLAPSDLT